MLKAQDPKVALKKIKANVLVNLFHLGMAVFVLYESCPLIGDSFTL